MNKLSQTFKSFFTLPTPVELGLANRNALGMKSLTPFQKGPTWEDWHCLVKLKHPVKYFIIEIFGRKLNNFMHRNINWLIDTKNKFLVRNHLLDLRNVDNLNPFYYGHISPATMIKLAMWKGLKTYIESELREDPRKLNFSEEEKLETWFQEMVNVYDETRALYHYWEVTRAKEQALEDSLYNASRVAIKLGNEKIYRKLSERITTNFIESEKREQDMLFRLAKISSMLI